MMKTPRRRAGTLLLVAVTCLVSNAAAAPGSVIVQDSFDKGAPGWTAAGNAVVSDISRRAGAKSLLIRQESDEEAASAWTSPAIANRGKPITISFWAADNYLKCPDVSYSACLEAVGSGVAITIPWDEARVADLWGKLLPSGLVWKYYQRTCTPAGDSFRLSFRWPKALMRGECYLTDVMVTEATDAEVLGMSATGPAPDAPKASALKLELSAPVLGNLFYVSDPLKFSILVYTGNQQPCTVPPDARVVYTITDYQRFFVAQGEAPFNDATPVADAAFYKSAVGRPRKCNLAKDIVVPMPAAREVGREFFIEVNLTSGSRVLASDTVSYGVVNPRRTPPREYGRCRFASTYFSAGGGCPGWGPDRRESISEKSGCSWTQFYDYEWAGVQPHYPGPYNFGKKWPAFPRMTYCPNLEQLRGDKKAMARSVPPEALISDPLHPGRVTFEIDAYVEYVVAAIRHHRDAVARVVPSGLERAIDARTVELHRKAYAAIKKEFPDLPVGLMLFGLPNNPSADVDIFLKEKLYECCDFVDEHIYSSSVDWSEWERLKAGCVRAGRKPPPLVSTEFSRVGGMDQVSHSREMVAAHLEAFARGMEHIYYFNQCNEGQQASRSRPFLREPTDLGGDQMSGFMYMQRVVRPRIGADYVTTAPRNRWESASWGLEFGGDSLMPLLQTLVYYNLVQNFEASAYRKTLRPTPNSTGYLFDRADATVAALWTTRPVGPETVRVKCAEPFTAQDLYGRSERVTPLQGVALVTLDENPLTLIWDRKAMDPAFEPAGGGLRLDPIAHGTTGTAELNLPAGWDGVPLRVACTVDGTWPQVPEQPLRTKPGGGTSLRLPVPVPTDRPVGRYPLTARVFADARLVALVRADLAVEDVLTAEVTGVPVTRVHPPAVKVTVRNLKETAAEGRVLLEDSFFAPGFRRRGLEQPFAAPAHGSVDVFFPVDRSLLNLATTYEIGVVVEEKGGLRVRKADDVSFRACERASGPISVDGDLADWNLANCTAIPFEREFTNWGKPRRDDADCSGVLYTCWDAENLHFAVVVRDDSSVVRANDVDIWQDDNVMFGLYPWGWGQGQVVNSGYYREHIGLCKDGVARVFRVGNVPGGRATAEGVKVAVKRVDGGYVYEWAYPRSSVVPLALQAGSRFRVSAFIMDRDWQPDGEKVTALGGVQLGGFNTGVDARPVKWREFLLTE